jgi:hypothetical protein
MRARADILKRSYPYKQLARQDLVTGLSGGVVEVFQKPNMSLDRS